jgi:hypothetical protein
MRKLFPVPAFLICAFLVSIPLGAQKSQFVDMKNVTNATDADAQKAAQTLDAMVTALGGERWMTLTDMETEGRTASFYHGNPSGGYTLFFSFHRFPTAANPEGEDRIELTKKRDVVEIVTAKDAWEVTFQGKHRDDKLSSEDFFRRREHSIDFLMRVWLKRPGNVLFYNGKKMTDSHLADEVTVLGADNDSITVLIDANTHLPRKRSFQWRDPVYKDKNTDGETYDDWHLAQGLPSSFLITRYRNGDMTRQQYLSKVSYNQSLPDSMFDPDLTAAKLTK